MLASGRLTPSETKGYFLRTCSYSPISPKPALFQVGSGTGLREVAEATSRSHGLLFGRKGTVFRLNSESMNRFLVRRRFGQVR
jgi:hypothetical protein